ncbi:zinc-binding alcohol dehydrogenase family protein [Micromonospora sp. NPDC048830]|uniref:quinone oxidoreductase family protein n=1 Tax=Micromonospora sp. NPDC048830 TaxID=3364257 RepID=UPI0037172930
MATTMQAVRVHDWGVAPVVEDVPMPQPADGETLVRVEAAAVGHLDRTVAGGEFRMKPTLPYVGGVEGCGRVVASDELAEGTRVMLRGAGLGLVRNGTWAQYVTVPTRSLSLLPEGMPPSLGATYFVPLTTAVTALRTVGRLGAWGVPDVTSAADEVVLVAGAAGAVGSMVAQLALREGARVLGLVLDQQQAERLPSGVEPLIASADGDVLSALGKERPATLLVDTLGGQRLNERMSWVRAGGRAVSIGYVAGEAATLDLPNWLLLDVPLLPVNMIRRSAEARALAEQWAPLLVSGELVLDVEEFDLAGAGRALELLGAGQLRGRAVLVPPTD